MNNFYLALLHYPVYDKNGAIVTTSVTNMDLHDISRSAKTFGVENFFIITPLASQRNFVQRILYHWQKGYGAIYNPLRKEALDIVKIRDSLDGVIDEIRSNTQRNVSVVATSASRQLKGTTYKDCSALLAEGKTNFLFLFGTGWGISEDVIIKSDIILEPISGPTSYNHLSVRSAVAIVLDRLAGQRPYLLT
ncbi:MAG: RNA methyltransferase [Syntrophales bacterium]|nr:RNA methyltransferase [Syntrophales bacterium]MDY0044567.1 RNA methyltransferase [Syntrophales bacterium]